MIFPLKIGILALYQVPLLQRSQISLQHGRVRKKLSPCVFALSLSLSLILSSSAFSIELDEMRVH